MKIDKKININVLVAGLMLLGFIFLFLHSETEIFDKHTDNCENVDVCLILNKAIFEKHSQNIKIFKIVFSNLLIPSFEINNNIDEIYESDFVYKIQKVPILSKIYIQNHNLLI